MIRVKVQRTDTELERKFPKPWCSVEEFNVNNEKFSRLEDFFHTAT